MDKTELLARISTIAVNTTSAVKMPIFLPGSDEPLKDKDGNEAFLLLMSEDSKAGRAFDKRISDHLISKIRRGGMKKAQDEDDPRAFQVDKIVALLVGWHLVDQNREAIPLDFNEENARWFLALDGMAWLCKQALVFVQNGGNFISASSTI